MIARCSLLIALVSVLLLAVPLTARDSGSGMSVDSLLYRSIRKLEINKPVQIEIMSGVRFTGTLAMHLADTLYLTNSMGERGIPFGSIKSIWKRGRSTKTGLLIGAGVGFVAGLLVGAYLGASERNMDDVSGPGAEFELWPFGGILIGTVSGGIIGGAIGWLIPKWHRCYKYRPPPPGVDDGRYGR